jgi:hypothetical protein
LINEALRLQNSVAGALAPSIDHLTAISDLWSTPGSPLQLARIRTLLDVFCAIQTTGLPRRRVSALAKFLVELDSMQSGCFAGISVGRVLQYALRFEHAPPPFDSKRS